LASAYLRQLAQEAVAELDGVERIENLIEVMAPPLGEAALGSFPGGGPTPAGTARLRARRANDTPEVPTTTRRILVVGDQRESAEHWALAIGGAGQRVRHTWHSSEAPVLAAEFQPDAVVLDLGLTGSNYRRIARRLREIPGLEATVLIALTEDGTEEDRQRAHAAGFDHHLAKPVDVAILLELLTRPGTPPGPA
jgi:CheY-like chemotaxis protein